MDVQSIVASVKKTGRLLIAHEAMKRAGAAGEIAFRVSEAAPDVVAAMKSPIKRLAAKNVPLPRSSELEAKLVPQVDDVVRAVKDVMAG
jgi:pyruvate dehydrogenase E1 component beta subunit